MNWFCWGNLEGVTKTCYEYFLIYYLKLLLLWNWFKNVVPSSTLNFVQLRRNHTVPLTEFVLPFPAWLSIAEQIPTHIVITIRSNCIERTKWPAVQCGSASKAYQIWKHENAVHKQTPFTCPSAELSSAAEPNVYGAQFTSLALKP